MQSEAPIKPVTYGLAFYFMISALDVLSISGLGSILKIAVFVPLGLMLLEYKALRIRLHPLLIFQFCFWLLAMVSMFYSVSADRTFSSDTTLTLNLMLVLMLGVLVPYNEKDLELLQKALLWGCWIQLVLTIISADVSSAGRLTLRFGSSTQDQNNNNTYFLYAFSYHCYHLLNGRNRKHILAVVMIIAMVLLSGSRGALVAFAMTFLFQIWIYFRNSRHSVRSIIVIVLVMILAGIAFDLILSAIPESVSVRFSLEYLQKKGTTGRSRIWANLWNLYKNASIPRMLFGHGYGTTILVNQMEQKVAHNLYLDNLITLGLVGVFLQVASQGMVAWIFHKRRKYVLLGAYVGMIGMCMSLSLTACKPLWNMILIALAIDYNSRESLSGE